MAYQVYQSQPEDERANKAVDDTKGLVVCSGNILASTYFFATSCGVTTSSDSVLFTNKEISYLAGQVQSTDISDAKKGEETGLRPIRMRKMTCSVSSLKKSRIC